MTREEIAEIIKSELGLRLDDIKQSTTDYMKTVLAGMPRPSSDKTPVIGGLIRALVNGKGDVDKAVAWAKRNDMSDDVTKALVAGTPSAAGYLIFPEYSTELTGLLYPNVVMRKMGTPTLPMRTGTLNITKHLTGATASYIGEGANLPVGTETVGQITLAWKKLACLVPISNDLLRYNSIAADTMVRNDLVRALATREDAAFIRDDGTSSKPKGLLYWINASNKFNSTGTTLAYVTADLAKAVYLVMNANVPMDGCGWIIAPRTYSFLWALLDSNGNPAFRGELLAGKLLGFPFAMTTQVPINLTSTYSEVYFVSFPECVIGEGESISIDTSDVAAYYDGSNVVAAFSLDQTVIRAIEEHDFALRHDVAASVIQNVNWI